MSRGKDKQPRFEEAIAELEAIIEQIESGQCGLEECLAQYERGMKLVGRCQAVLSVVQQRIAELTADNGRLRVAAGAEDDPADEAEGATDGLEAEVDDEPSPDTRE